MKLLFRLAGFGLLTAFAGMALAGPPADSGMDGVYQALEKAAGGGSVLLAQAETPPAVDGNLLIEPGDDAAVTFTQKQDMPGTPLNGKSIEELVVGKPLFPPIEGLDESIWKDKPCGTCHQWTKERLCVQAKTYVGREQMVERLAHPYGLPFKELLERWGEGGCQ